MSKSLTTTDDGTKMPVIHSGRILLEDMKDEEISINGLAQAIRVPAILCPIAAFVRSQIVDHKWFYE